MGTFESIQTARRAHCRGGRFRRPAPRQQDPKLYHPERAVWNKPEYTELRFGFEITPYATHG
jgi:coenzyme PQQ precursor peptide PqqA